MGFDNPGVKMKNVNLQKLAELLEINDNTDIVSLIIQEITNNTVEIEDIGKTGSGYEIFMSDNSAFTGKELNQLYEFFDIVEIGIYGDQNLPNEKAQFHMIVKFP